MIFTVPIQCYLKKKRKYKRQTLLTPQCDFYYHQTFNSYMIFLSLHIKYKHVHIFYKAKKTTTTKTTQCFISY